MRVNYPKGFYYRDDINNCALVIYLPIFAREDDMKHSYKERRRSLRYPTVIKGFYYLDEKQGKGKECTIINISLNGAGLQFYTDETVEVKTKLCLDMYPPGGSEPVNVEGIVKWMKQGNKDCVCGIELMKPLDEATMEVLRM